MHQAKASRKSAIHDLWDNENLKHEMEKASSSRFRTVSDIHTFYLSGLVASESKKAKVSFACEEIFKYITDRNVHDKTIYNVIKELRPLLFCINDNVTYQHEAFRKYLQGFLEDYFNSELH